MAGAQASGSGSTAYTKAVEFPADFHGCICALGCYTLFSVNPALDTIVRAAGSRGLTAVDFRKAKLGAIFEHATDRGRPRTSRSLFDQQEHWQPKILKLINFFLAHLSGSRDTATAVKNRLFP
jgi:hypothetical protein